MYYIHTLNIVHFPPQTLSYTDFAPLEIFSTWNPGCLFPIHHIVLISNITWKVWVFCNSATHQMAPLLPRMHYFMSKAAKKLQPTSYSHLHTSLSCYYVCKYVWQQNSGHLWLYYTSDNRFPTKVASFWNTKRGMAYKLLSRMVSSQIHCTLHVHLGYMDKILHTDDLYTVFIR